MEEPPWVTKNPEKSLEIQGFGPDAFLAPDQTGRPNETDQYEFRRPAETGTDEQTIKNFKFLLPIIS